VTSEDEEIQVATLQAALEQYLDSLKAEHRNTHGQYVRKYVEYTGAEVELQDLSRARVESYVESQISTTDPAAQERVTALKGWFKYLHKEGLTEDNYGVQVRVKRVSNGRSSSAASRRQAIESVDMTAEGVQALRAELESLEKEMPAIREAIAEARQDKDFRENAPLDAAREAMAFNDQRRKEIEATLKRARVVNSKGSISDVTAVGSLVTVTRVDTEQQMIFKLVGPREANASDKKISVESPVGKELLGRRPGDEVEVEVPSGTINYRVDAVTQG
jgi:transcription elongation factor GreA